LYTKKKIVNTLHTKQKEVENNEKLRKTYINADPVYTSLKDEKFRYVFANDALCKFIGDREDNIIGKTDIEFLKEEAKKIRKIDEQVIQTMDTVESVENLRGQIYKVTKFPVELLNGEYGVGGYLNNITEKEEINRKLKENRNKLRSILETTQDGFWIVGENSKIVDVNNAYCKMSGYSKEEILNSTISDLEFLENPEDTEKRKERIKETGHDLFETKHIKKDGEIFDVEVSISLFSKKPLEFICFFRDITEKKKYDEKIIEIKERLENLTNQTPGVTYQYQLFPDGTSKFPYASKGIYDIYEVEPEEIIDDASIVFTRIHPDDYENVVNTIQKSADNLEIWDDEYRVILPEKGEKWVRGSAKPQKQKDGSILWHGNIREITKEKKLQLELKDQKERLENIIEGTNSGTWEMDVGTDEVFINKKYSEMLGYDFKEISPLSLKKWRYLVHHEDFDIVEKEIKRLIDKEIEYYNLEIRMKHKNGKWIWINSRAKVTKWNDKGEAILISGILTDITAKKENEEKIYNQKEEFKTTLMSVGDAVISTDKKGKIKLMNNVAEDLTGWSQEDAYNQPLEKVLNIINEYTRQICENPAEKALRLGKIVEMANHTILITKDGKEIPIEDSAAPIKDRDENVTGAVIVFRDFTDKREKQIEYLSFHDHLTGLYNRRYMEDSMKRLDSKRNIPFSIIVVDVNGLKLTNDAYGHSMGDKLLVKVAEILKKSCREDDIICRVGGDEFLVLLPGTNTIEAEEIKNRIIETSHKTSLDSVIISLALGHATKKPKDKDILETYKEADNNMYKNKLKYGKIMRNKTIETVLVNINNKYDHEQIHTQRVSQYCESIARAMNLNSQEIEDSKVAGTLHDIGKIIVPPEILSKEEKLSYEEWETIKKHTITGYQLLKSVDEYSHLAEAVLHHHEKLDGSGYPEGLLEDEIPLLSKIIAVADTYEAMTANRPYQKKKTKEEAVAELKKHAGIQFDVKIVDIFVNRVL
jgi:diguanylate cyclase (GGDEF)-like protein/PAS domain S-box-containing protein